MENPTEIATYLGYAAGWRSVRWMPDRAAYRCSTNLADQLWRRQGAGVKQLQRNLRRVVPDADEAEIREISPAGHAPYFRYWCDAFRLPDWSENQILDTFRMGNKQVLRRGRRVGHRCDRRAAACGQPGTMPARTRR